MKKRGQATLFVIIGFLIVLSLSLTYYALTIRGTILKEQSKELPTTQDMLPAKYLIDRCLSLVSSQGVVLLGKRGGYIEHPFPRLETRPTEKEILAYFYLRRRDTQPKMIIPPLEYMQNELQRYVRDYLRYCLDDFEFFSHKGINVKMQNMAVNVTIADEAIAVNLYFPVTLKTGDKITELKDFVETLPIRLGEIHKLATELVKETGTFEQNLKQEVKRKINACDSKPTLDTKFPLEKIASRFQKLRVVNHESDCQQETAFCDTWTVKVTVQYKPMPLADCQTEIKEVHQLAPLTTVYGILDDDAPQHPYVFLFMTKINIDEEGFCNYNC